MNFKVFKMALGIFRKMSVAMIDIEETNPLQACEITFASPTIKPINVAFFIVFSTSKNLWMSTENKEKNIE